MGLLLRWALLDLGRSDCRDVLGRHYSAMSADVWASIFGYVCYRRLWSKELHLADFGESFWLCNGYIHHIVLIYFTLVALFWLIIYAHRWSDVFRHSFMQFHFCAGNASNGFFIPSVSPGSNEALYTCEEGCGLLRRCRSEFQRGRICVFDENQ